MSTEQVFNPEAFEHLATVEDDSFWFRSRNRLIVWALNHYFPAARSMLEIGCGTGYVLTGLREARPEMRLVGGEYFPDALEIASRRLPGVELTAHFHNTRGQGLANVLAALSEGVQSFESAFGELGGSPVSPGATGNISTEDTVSMLHEMGIETGIDLAALIAAARAAQELLGRPLGAHVLRAGAVDWHR